MGTATILKLGQWGTLADSFVAHPSSPTGAILDLNDGSTFALLDSSGLGDGLDLGYPRPTIYSSQNPRVVGERVVRRIYNKNREITAHLWVGPTASYATLATAWRNLIGLVEAISPTNPAALQIQVTGASAAVYADVLAVEMEARYEELMTTQLVDETIVVKFICRPYLRGARQTLQNLAYNPGFEAPSGPGITVFNDTFATANAYAVQAGGALVQDKAYYPDVVLADGPIRYYRLDEASGTTVFDAGSGNQNGTTHASPTQNVAGLLTGDSDTCYTFTAASSQYISAASTGFPTGAGAFSVEAWVKIAANPASTAYIASWGLASSNNVNVQLYVTSGGLPTFATTGTAVTGAALTTGTPHHIVGTYDGSNLRLYVDGSLAAGPTAATLNIPSAPSFALGALAWSLGNYWNGQMDEAAVYTTALSATRVTAHYNAGHNTPSSASNTLALASGNRVSFGSPIWGAINLWIPRFRFFAGATATFYLHYTDANNYLAVVVTATALTLNHVVGGTTHQLATTSFQLINGLYYWLRIAQFPTVTGNTAQVQVGLFEDGVGGSQGTQSSTQLGSTLGSVATFDAVTALSGAPQIGVSGAALGLGGGFSNVHTLSLFGPGAWTFTGGGGTGTCSGAWDGARTESGMGGSAANTFPNGPKTSFGSGRIDLAPAGTVDAKWQLYTGGTPAGTWAMPVSAAGDVLYARCTVKSSGLGNGATVKLDYTEYNSSGSSLRSGTLQTLTISGGVQIAWPAVGAYSLSGNWTTGANCAYVDIQLHVADTVAGNSAGGIVWFDSVQVWDSTTTGTTNMPYCELRFPQSPAQLMVSGIQGDAPALATVQMGLYLASWATNHSLNIWMGRRATSSAGALLVGACLGWFGPTIQTPPLVHTTAALDTTSYGGFYIKNTSGDGHGWRPRFTSMLAQDCIGSYHAMMRGYTVNATPTAVGMSFVTQQRQQAWYGLSSTTNADQLGESYTAYQYGFSAQNTWTTVDSGLITLPPFTNAVLADPAQTYVVPAVRWGVANEQDQTGWAALLPCDGEMLLATAYNPVNAVSNVTTQWLYVYWDAYNTATTYSVESAPLPNAAHAGGSVGTSSTGSISVNQTGATMPLLDPNLRLTNSSGLGVNQYVIIANDDADLILPVAVDITYSPLYLQPK